MLEKQIEAALIKKVKSLNGICEKFCSAQKRSVPDRLIILNNNRIIFVECKRPGGKPTENQLRDHAKRRALGCDVRVIDSMEQVEAFPKEIP